MNIVGKRVAYITLGCKLNFSETSTIKHSLEQEGAVTVGEKDGADIFVINTCSVTDIAEKKGRQMIRKIIHRNPGAYIVVVGCYAQLKAQEIMDIEGVHLVLNAQDKFNVAHYLNHLEEQERHEPHSCDIFGVKTFDLAYSYGDRTRCFLKIQDGCDYFCSYCTIPFARGRSRSAAIQDVIKAARDVASKGIKEIILTGVNTGDFGRETGETFLDLIRTLDELEEIQRFRISSIEPNLLTDDIIRFVASSRRFMPHFHVPLQSGSNEVLHLMRRRYERELFAEKVQGGRDCRNAGRNTGGLRRCPPIHCRTGCFPVTRVPLFGTFRNKSTGHPVYSPASGKASSGERTPRHFRTEVAQFLHGTRGTNPSGAV